MLVLSTSNADTKKKHNFWNKKIAKHRLTVVENIETKINKKFSML